MSEEQQHGNAQPEAMPQTRRPLRDAEPSRTKPTTTSRATKPHTARSSHAAESWRELAGDVRQWADDHRLAVTATAALVTLNLVAWLVAAMAGFAFPLRLSTSMSAFNAGKLICSLFLARGVIQLMVDAVLWLVMLSIAEPWLGRVRTVVTALACAAGGVLAGLTLCAAAGWMFQDSLFVSRMRRYR